MPAKFNFSAFAKIVIFLVSVLFFLFMCGSYDCGISGFQGYLSASLPKILIILFLFVLVKLITSSIKLVIARKEENEEESKLVNGLRLARYALWAVFVLIVTTLVFHDFGALITSLGLIGFGITFSLQKPIMNFVGWLNINFNRPFRVGDRIKIGNFSGDVIEIKMMNTVIKSMIEGFDQYSGKILTIPNELVLIEPVENYTKEDNFLKTKLEISITYESDWRKAKNIFESIVSDVTKKNLHKYRKRLARRISFIDETIEKLSSRFEKASSKEREKKIKEKISELEKQKENIQESFEELPSWFKPKVYVDLSESSITLLALFSVPYNKMRSSKTEINMSFLESIRKEKNIEIAYPHLKIISGKRNNYSNTILSDFEEKELMPETQKTDLQQPKE
ncbi:mechanosensitive ion channel family protein [Candidatus Micrarchaeota archaeon]|nr:mechanosensitive ion channel family protein [Candidatus Micrarchaeota archaeon]